MIPTDALYLLGKSLHHLNNPLITFARHQTRMAIANIVPSISIAAILIASQFILSTRFRIALWEARFRRNKRSDIF